VSKKLILDEAVERFKTVHGDLYDYSQVKYLNNKIKVTITCRLHGDFSQRPDNHLSGSGCPMCGRFKDNKIGRPMFKKLSDAVANRWGDKYDLSKISETYTKPKSVVDIFCRIHGKFNQSLKKLASGGGCPLCELERKKVDGKICSTCKVAKPLKYFHVNNNAPDKKNSLCKTCAEIDRNKPATYALYGDKLVIGDKPENRDGRLFVACKQCRKSFQPTRKQCHHRIEKIRSLTGESNFYCSETCKTSCDIFHVSKLRKSQRPKAQKDRACATPVKRGLQISQCEEFGYTFCERCGDTIDTDLHHTNKIANSGKDVNNPAGMMLLCFNCHTELHRTCK
jgi:5-methylcytosine-specific restriction endonuclease McrA